MNTLSGTRTEVMLLRTSVAGRGSSVWLRLRGHHVGESV
jgi:hypothetical protein